jgi:hypothetical protein
VAVHRPANCYHRSRLRVRVEYASKVEEGIGPIPLRCQNFERFTCVALRQRIRDASRRRRRADVKDLPGDTPIEHAFAIEVPSLEAAGNGRQERQGRLRHLVP